MSVSVKIPQHSSASCYGRAMRKAVAYFRVNTAHPKASGLGIEAQIRDVDRFCRENGYRVVEERVEIETGRRPGRPKLAEALNLATRLRALFLIARLDRLSRDIDFVTSLLESRARFRACDIPSLNRRALRIRAPVIAEEALAISTRMKGELAAAKAHGVLLGASNPACRNLPPGAGHRGGISSRVARRRLRDSALASVAGKIKALRAKGYGFGQIAATLNDDRHVTATGGRWRASSVWRAARRIGATEP